MNELAWRGLLEISEIAEGADAKALSNASTVVSAVTESVADLLPIASPSVLRSGLSASQSALAAINRMRVDLNASPDFLAGQLAAITDILGFATASILDDACASQAMMGPLAEVVIALRGGSLRAFDLSYDKPEAAIRRMLDDLIAMQVVTNHRRGDVTYSQLTPAGKLLVEEFMSAAASTASPRNAGHLRRDLVDLTIGGRFMCGGNEWLVTDIGTRTLTAIKIDETAKADPRWLEGPVYALVETSFDEDDIKVIEPL
jgi:hypothetical protein